MNVLETFSLAGKVALVVGGYGQYGTQIVAALAEAGARTYIASRTMGPLEEAAIQHRLLGHDVRPLRLDLADEASIVGVRDAIVAESGRLDVLVNSAVARPMRGFDDPLAGERFQESMRVNATGNFLICRAAGNAMAEQGGGSIINISSMMGVVGPNPANYEGTTMSAWGAPDYFFHKAGMINFTRFIASYYGSRGVRCNCISPGGFRSPAHPEPFVRQYGARTCLGRLANDTDLKGAIVFLASDASLYVTGVNMAVDGGYTAK